jgi:hypothetical protein
MAAANGDPGLPSAALSARPSLSPRLCAGDLGGTAGAQAKPSTCEGGHPTIRLVFAAQHAQRIACEDLTNR